MYSNIWSNGRGGRPASLADDDCPCASSSVLIRRWIALRVARGVDRAPRIEAEGGKDEVAARDAACVAGLVDARDVPAPRLHWLLDLGISCQRGKSQATGWAAITPSYLLLVLVPVDDSRELTSVLVFAQAPPHGEWSSLIVNYI